MVTWPARPRVRWFWFGLLLSHFGFSEGEGFSVGVVMCNSSLRAEGRGGCSRADDLARPTLGCVGEALSEPLS
eukprot:SAG31_NODE_20459_length_573_cov_3.531646_2_plen_73_part_00